jgi:hypothetical protein
VIQVLEILAACIVGISLLEKVVSLVRSFKRALGEIQDQ